MRVGPLLGMRVVIGIPKPLTRRALGHGLEALVRINEDWLRAHPDAPDLYESGVRYELEPEGYELWDPYALLLQRGAGDCDDLACAQAAILRVRYGERGARADSYPSRIDSNGRRTWHAVVVRENGTVEDPSARLGMRTHRGHLADGAPWRDVVDAHEHLEGDDAFAAHAAERERAMEIRWQVRPLEGGGWEGWVCFPAPCRGGFSSWHQVTHQAASPGDALEHALESARDTAHGLEACGLDFGSMIPGLLDTASSLVRTFTGSPTRPPMAPPTIPSGFPPQLAPLAMVSSLRVPYGSSGYPPTPPSWAPVAAPTYAPTYAPPMLSYK